MEIGKVRKVGGEYVTVFPDREENCTYDVIEGEPHYDWPPQNWKPEPVDWSAWKEARWIKTMFFKPLLPMQDRHRGEHGERFGTSRRDLFCASRTRAASEPREKGGRHEKICSEFDGPYA